MTGPNSYGEVADRGAAWSGRTIRRKSDGGWVITGTMTQRNTCGASWSSTYRCDLTPQGDVNRLAVRPLP